RPGRRDRRPGRDRPDVEGQRARGPRGDRKIHGAPGRQQGLPQAARDRGRRSGREAATRAELMRAESFDWDGSDPAALAGEIRALRPSRGGWGEPVEAIIAEVRTGGDRAVAEIEARVGDVALPADRVRQPDEALMSAAERLDPDLVAALEIAAANIHAVAEAQIADDQRVTLPQGQTVDLREAPVGSAGIY